MKPAKTLALTFIICVLLPLSLHAHPGIRIVMDSRGNVFFTDLKHVWKISPEGKKTVAVANVHTHELCLDAEDNLYGEHLWYEGEASDKWGHYVWKLSAEGKLEIVIPRREGFLQNYSFVRDRVGNMYWIARGDTTIVHKRALDGTITALCTTTELRDVRWMTASASGTVYFIDGGDLHSVTPEGILRTIARDLKERRAVEFIFGSSHNLMGLWLDAENNIYVAITGGRLVKRVSQAGEVKIIARSSVPWTPTGGLIAPNGEL